MGKQKKTGALYHTHSEVGGQKREETKSSNANEARRRNLRFDSCAISLNLFDPNNVVCDPKQGTVFDLLNILPLLLEEEINPVTKTPLKRSELVQLNYSRNPSTNRYHCPATYKEFTPTTHIVMIKPSGYVYAYEAIEKLNLKPKNMKDLMTDVPFERTDIITLQAGMNDNLDNSDVLPAPSLSQPNNQKTSSKNTFKKIETRKEDIRTTTEQKRVLELLEESTRKREQLLKEKLSNQANLKNIYASSTTPELLKLYEDIAKIQPKKPIVRFRFTIGINLTNEFTLDFELFSQRAPKTVFNFIQLIQSQYYHNTLFHRLVPQRLIQGGDPTGTGTGGESYFGSIFEDEFTADVPELNHAKVGVLSMANSGRKGTNQSQFIITIGSCPNLNGRHVGFGCLIQSPSNSEALKELGILKANPQDSSPLSPIVVKSVLCLINPLEHLITAYEKQKTTTELAQQKDIVNRKQPDDCVVNDDHDEKKKKKKKKKEKKKKRQAPIISAKHSLKKSKLGGADFSAW